MQNELRLSQDSLRVLAANTGGFAAVNQNDFNSAFDRIVQENSSYYVLGFYSTNERRAGRYRKLEVRVKRPGLRVVACAQRLLRGARAAAEPAGRVAQRHAAAAGGVARQPAAGRRRADEGVCRRLQGRGAERGRGAGRSSSTPTPSTSSRRTALFLEQLDIAHTATDSKGKVIPGRAAQREPVAEAGHLRAREGHAASACCRR